MSRRTAVRALASGVGLGAVLAACGPPAETASTAAHPPTAPPQSTESATSGNRGAETDTLPFHVAAGPRARPQVALTFHGQGGFESASQLLREVEAAGARITVLAVGSWLDEQPAIARRILDGGHELGNHTMNHRDIGAMNAADAFTEIAQCAERLTRLTGSPGRWFRPSRAEACTPLVAEQARLAGYAHCLGYDLDSLDFTDPGAQAVTHTVLDRIRPGSVVSLHFGHPGTVAAMPQILDGLRARALRPVTMSELVN